jgi:hypothetical protein
VKGEGYRVKGIGRRVKGLSFDRLRMRNLFVVELFSVELSFDRLRVVGI